MLASPADKLPPPQTHSLPEPSSSRITSITAPFDSPASDITVHEQSPTQAALSSRCVIVARDGNTRFHRRSRNGCEMCKSRRVRCDEAKPVCKNCKSRDTHCAYRIVVDKPSGRNGTSEETTRLAEQTAEWASPRLTPNSIEARGAIGPHRNRSISQRADVNQSHAVLPGLPSASMKRLIETDIPPGQLVHHPSINGYTGYSTMTAGAAAVPDPLPINLPPLSAAYLGSGTTYRPIFPHSSIFPCYEPDVAPVSQTLNTYASTATGSMVLQAPPLNQGLSVLLGPSATDRIIALSDVGSSNVSGTFSSTGSRDPTTTPLYEQRVSKPNVNISTLFGGLHNDHAAQDEGVLSSQILLPDQQNARPNGISHTMPTEDSGYSRQPLSALSLIPDAHTASLSMIVPADTGASLLYEPRFVDRLSHQEDEEEVLEIQTKDLSAYHKLRASYSIKEFSDITAIISSHLPHVRKEGHKLIGSTKEDGENDGGDEIRDVRKKRAMGVFSTDDGLVLKRLVGVDELKAYFPSPDQRQQYRHYVNETVEAIVAVSTPKARNPWRQHFVQMALNMPHGTSIAHDAFRLGILSLASFDMGFKMSGGRGLVNPDENVMYAASIEQRADALKLLNSIVVLKPYQVDIMAADLAIGTAVSLCIRDRLAGEADWKDPLKLGIDLIREYGGPEGYLSVEINPSRRFLLEQMACQEMIESIAASVLSLDPAKLVQPDSTWMERYLSEEDFTTDHIEIVYGLDSLGVFPHQEVQASIDIKVTALRAITHAFVAEGEALKNATLPTSTDVMGRILRDRGQPRSSNAPPRLN
ncbi:hypothetical protein QFC19_006654 [Naganishia cerealis]|uniref:Uncharacterized protein n=1 Tax=Naganishia cerealis TaxID=610337 RepID=A0ACC2VG83_9TREE|nr:hypothetical protein QFC19_006654 [Naganishia cerealis]